MAEDALKEIITDNLGNLENKERKELNRMMRKLVRTHCDLGQFCEEHFPDVILNSGGT